MTKHKLTKKICIGQFCHNVIFIQRYLEVSRNKLFLNISKNTVFHLFNIIPHSLGLLRWALVVKNPPNNAGDIRDLGSIPGLGRSPRGVHGNPLHYSCLENFTDRGAWWATVHRVAKSWTWLKQLSMHTSIYGTCFKKFPQGDLFSEI